MQALRHMEYTNEREGTGSRRMLKTRFPGEGLMIKTVDTTSLKSLNFTLKLKPTAVDLCYKYALPHKAQLNPLFFRPP